MFEKVNPHHPDKVADRIAGALVDIAYARSEGGLLKANPRIAAEVLIGHGTATVIVETSLGRQELTAADVRDTVTRICPSIAPDNVHVLLAQQDTHLADNQAEGLRCGDNGIFRGMPVTKEQKTLTAVAASIHANFPTDGKYIITSNGGGSIDFYDLTICQSNATKEQLLALMDEFEEHHYQRHGYNFDFSRCTINPLGPWTGGTNVDSGATNRKLGSDMGDAVSGGGLHGKDLSKMDVTANIICHMLAQRHHTPVECYCAIGDESLTFRFPQPGDFPDNLPAHPDITMTVAEAVEMARLYILTDCGGSFERFAEWGLIRPNVEVE